MEKAKPTDPPADLVARLERAASGVIRNQQPALRHTRPACVASPSSCRSTAPARSSMPSATSAGASASTPSSA